MKRRSIKKLRSRIKKSLARLSKAITRETNDQKQLAAKLRKEMALSRHYKK